MAKKEANDEPRPVTFNIPKERLGDPKAYVEAAALVLNAVGAGALESTDAKREMELLRETCSAWTGIELSEITQNQSDPLVRLQSIMESGEEELLKVEKAYQQIDDLKLPPDVKKKYSDLIRRVIRLQREARDCPMKLMAYVGRDDDPERAGEPFLFSGCHAEMFDGWNSVETKHSLEMAPPGHGKSTCLRYQIAWEIGDNPTRRHLYITDEKGKAEQTGLTLFKIIASRRYRSVFPEIRLLSRQDKATQSGIRWSVSRSNTFARDTTFFGAAIGSLIQGNRFDRIWGDDFCSPEVRQSPTKRNWTNQQWNTVVEPRLADETGRIRVICTPWHPDDTAGRIIQRQKEGNAPTWTVKILSIEDDEYGMAIPIWNKFSVDYFEDKKARNPTDYDLLYRLRSTVHAKRSIRNVRFYNSQINSPRTSEADKRLLEAMKIGDKTLSVDPSASSNEQSSDTGIIEGVLAKNPYGSEYAFITDCWIFHDPPGAVRDWIIERIVSEFQAGVPYKNLVIEAQGGIKGMVSLWVVTITEELQKRNCPVPNIVTPGTRVGGTRQNRGKLARLVECAGYLEGGIVRFAGRRIFDRVKNNDILQTIPGSNIDKLTSNILSFDGTNCSDAVDAVTQWILHFRSRMANPNTPLPTRKKMEKQTDVLTSLLAQQMERMKRIAQQRCGVRSEEQEFLKGRMVC